MPRPTSVPVDGGPASCFDHEVLAAVLQVRQAQVHVLLWRRARPPHAGRWALPGGRLGAREDLEASISRQLAEKVDVRDLSHLEQLETLGAPHRMPTGRTLATTYLGLVPGDVEPAVPDDTRWQPADDLPRMAFDHAAIVEAARRRLRSKLSYTNLGFALAPARFTMSELATYYRAALGHEVRKFQVWSRNAAIPMLALPGGPSRANCATSCRRSLILSACVSGSRANRRYAALRRWRGRATAPTRRASDSAWYRFPPARACADLQ